MDVSARVESIKECYTALSDMGLHDGVSDGVAQFKRVANAFVRDGAKSDGKIQIPEVGRVLMYSFSPNRKARVFLRATS
jgi:hypothetical protein